MSESYRIRLHMLCRELAAWLDGVADGKRLTRDERRATWTTFGLLREHCNALDTRREHGATAEIR